MHLANGWTHGSAQGGTCLSVFRAAMAGMINKVQMGPGMGVSMGDIGQK